MSPAAQRVSVQVGERTLALSNLAKPLYPDGTTKAQVVEYYTRIAPVLLPHLAGRALTLKRYPNGSDGSSFYEKNAPRGHPDWVRTVRLPAPGSTKDREMIDYVVLEEVAGLVWTANLAALELHTPMWRVDADDQALPPDLLVIDLDPGPPATAVQCCAVALAARSALAAEGLSVLAKTSGSKGLQLYAPLRDGLSAQESSGIARALAERLERAHPELVVSRMTKALRPGKVLVDWSQNSAAKTTVSVYSLRARDRPTVSTPITWEEVESCLHADDPTELVFTAVDVLKRVERDGDLFAPVLLDDTAMGELR